MKSANGGNSGMMLLFDCDVYVAVASMIYAVREYVGFSRAKVAAQVEGIGGGSARV